MKSEIPGASPPGVSDRRYGRSRYQRWRGKGAGRGKPESNRTGRPGRLSRWSRWNAAVRRGARADRRNRIEREKMAQTFTGRKRVRKFFGTINEVAEMPNLIEVQKASYDQFLLVKEPVG